MTDFKSHLNSRRRRKVSGKWQSLLAVIITFVLVSIIVLGFLRGIMLKGGLKRSVWDGLSPLAIALNTNPATVFIFQKETKKIAFLVIPADIGYATGDANEPVKNVYDSVRNDEEAGRRFLEKYFGAKIGGYVQFKGERKMSKGEAERIFKDFAFLTTPASIIFNGLGKEVDGSNLSRIDMLKLWWKVKGVSIDDLEFVDLGNYSIEIIGGDKNFKGLDRDVLRKSLSSYFEDFRVAGAHIDVETVNASGGTGIGLLASEIAEIAGFDVVGITSDDSLIDKTKIVASGNKKDVYYLAKLFNCDIFWQENEAGKTNITLFLGRDFAETYK